MVYRPYLAMKVDVTSRYGKTPASIPWRPNENVPFEKRWSSGLFKISCRAVYNAVRVYIVLGLHAVSDS